MATLQDILSPVWTLSKNGGGVIIEGIAAIRQALDIIITTSKGSDPLRPEFGCDAMLYQDMPVNIAAPLIKKALFDAITTWENRVTITKITSSLIGNSNLVFNIGYTLADGFEDQLNVDISTTGISTQAVPVRLILNGLLPPNPISRKYSISLSLNGAVINPLPPSSGFIDINSLFYWVQNNWGIYGLWYLTSNAIVGSMNPQYTSGTISISLFAADYFYASVIPILDIGKKYALQVVYNGTTYNNTADLFTANDLLNYVRSNDDFNAMGSWHLESTPGDFNNDFSNDFNKNNYSLVLATTQEGVSMNITTITI